MCHCSVIYHYLFCQLQHRHDSAFAQRSTAPLERTHTEEHKLLKQPELMMVLTNKLDL
jgi:hypothetical protein